MCGRVGGRVGGPGGECGGDMRKGIVEGRGKMGRGWEGGEREKNV